MKAPAGSYYNENGVLIPENETICYNAKLKRHFYISGKFERYARIIFTDDGTSRNVTFEQIAVYEKK